MLLPRAALLAAILAAVALPARAFDDDKPLKETLKVRETQSGFAGVTGKEIRVQTDGKWAEYTIRGSNAALARSGKLTKKELAKLGKDVDQYSPGTLKTTGKAKVNPHVITVSYGKHSAKLTTAGGEMPKPDTESMEGRFAGVLAAVQSALPKVKGKGK